MPRGNEHEPGDYRPAFHSPAWVERYREVCEQDAAYELMRAAGFTSFDLAFLKDFHIKA